MDLQLTEGYPIQVPTVRFLTSIYHPNVDPETGQICQDIVEKDWSPVLKVKDGRFRTGGRHPSSRSISRFLAYPARAFMPACRQSLSGCTPCSRTPRANTP